MNAPTRKLPKPVDFDQLYPGRFLKSGELLGKKRTVTIDDIEIDELENEKGKKVQGIIHLKETEKQIVLNKTNGLCLRGMFGRKLSEWKGKRITIFQDQVRFGADTVDAIRIWGSPDIERDLQVTITLPRKKPFVMTMHKVSASGDQSARQSTPQTNGQRDAAATTNVQTVLVGNQRQPYTTEAAIAALRACEDDATRASVWKDVQRDFETAGKEVPLDVEAVNQEMKESFAL